MLDRVLDTTLALHGEHGYASPVDDVADQADVRKTTIYRRWPRRRPTSLLRWRDLRPCRFPALRVSGLDGGEEGPVGSAGVEQAADEVVSEVHQSERDALDPFREVVHGFGRAVRDV
ncbi:MAG: helix-turn-helix domain-containing protein [Actinomycetes bacterium]